MNFEFLGSCCAGFEETHDYAQLQTFDPPDNYWQMRRGATNIFQNQEMPSQITADPGSQKPSFP